MQDENRRECLQINLLCRLDSEACPRSIVGQGFGEGQIRESILNRLNMIGLLGYTQSQAIHNVDSVWSSWKKNKESIPECRVASVDMVLK